MRADAMLEAGDLDGYAVWKRVLRAVEELQGVGPVRARPARSSAASHTTLAQTSIGRAMPFAPATSFKDNFLPLKLSFVLSPSTTPCARW